MILFDGEHVFSFFSEMFCCAPEKLEDMHNLFRVARQEIGILRRIFYKIRYFFSCREDMLC